MIHRFTTRLLLFKCECLVFDYVLRDSLRLPDETFAKAKPPMQGCEHLRVKFWGDRYGTGMRCKDCGKEVGGEDKLQQTILEHCGVTIGTDPLRTFLQRAYGQGGRASVPAACQAQLPTAFALRIQTFASFT